MTSVSYILAAYRGARGGTDATYARDPDHFLRQHLQSLQQLHHELAEIIVVLNEDGERPLDLPTELGGTKVIVERRPNRGLSYGAFARGVQLASSEYVLLMEDDYAFAVDDFDRVLVERAQSEPKLGFLCGAVDTKPTPSGPAPLGATVFLGLARTQTTKEVLAGGYDGQPIVREDNSRDTGWYSQVAWSRSYMVAGYSLTDWLSSFACAAWFSERERLLWYDRDARPADRTPVRASGGFRQVIGNRTSRGAVRINQPAPSRAARFSGRRSLVVPLQAVARPRVEVEANGERFTARLGVDGLLVV